MEPFELNYLVVWCVLFYCKIPSSFVSYSSYFGDCYSSKKKKKKTLGGLSDTRVSQFQQGQSDAKSNPNALLEDQKCSPLF